jgi:hypothetical protein
VYLSSTAKTVISSSSSSFLIQNWRTGGHNMSCLGGLVPVEEGK